MKSTRYEGSEIRRVLLALAFDEVVCARVTSQWPAEGLFAAPWENLVGGWCVNFYRRYQQPPKERLVSLFDSWAESSDNKEVIGAVERFLRGLSDDYRSLDGVTSDFLLDDAAKHFNRVRIEREMEVAKVELDRGDVAAAQTRLAGLSRKVELGLGAYIEPAKDVTPWLQAFEEERVKPLITYPGDLGVFFENTMARGQLFAFLAPDKSGKTSWMMDTAYRAVRRRNRVAFFDTGDGSEEEAMARLACRTMSQPEYPGNFKIPDAWTENGIDFREVTIDSINPVEGFRKFSKIALSPDAIRIACYPNSSISAAGIDGVLSDWEKSGWTPDVVVIDYADILAPPAGIRDEKEQIDETWRQLRRMSQARRCLIVTATQANAASYKMGTGWLGPQNFSGRKTKNAHVNGIIGINISEEERKNGVCRLNWVVRRKNRSDRPAGRVAVAGWYDVGNPALVSRRVAAPAPVPEDNA